MNILCIYSVETYVSEQKPLASPTDIPFGISYIATSLKKAGFSPRMMVFCHKSNYKKMIKSYISQYKPKMFCLTAVTSQYQYIYKIAGFIKEIAPESFAVIGGHHVTLNPEIAIKGSAFDALCTGEGEKAIVEYALQVASNREPSRINNMWIRNRESGAIEKNPQSNFIQNLDELPYIDRNIWKEWIGDVGTTFTVLAGRGCPHRCTYCSNHALARVSRGKYLRFRSPGNIVGEIKEIVKEYPSIRTIYIEIETMGADIKYAYNLCVALSLLNKDLEHPLTFGINMAVSQRLVGNRELFEHLRSANFRFVTIGLESGSKRVREEILRRPKYSNADIIAFSKMAREYGIEIHMQVMVGFPGETKKDFKETISCARDCNPELASLSIFYPYPGTDLYKITKDMGLIPDHIVAPENERTKAPISFPDFSRTAIQREYYLFYLKVYIGKRALIKVLAMVLRNYIYSHPSLNAYYKQLLSLRFFAFLKEKLTTFR